MALWYCPDCTAAYAVGLAACPQCGRASDHLTTVPAETLPPASDELREHPGTGEAMQGVEAPADGSETGLAADTEPAAEPEPAPRRRRKATDGD